MSMLDIVIKSSILLLVAALAAGLGRRFAAAHRHFIWMLMMAGLVVLPLLVFAAPFRLPVIPRCVVRGAWCVGQAAPIVAEAPPSFTTERDITVGVPTPHAPRPTPRFSGAPRPTPGFSDAPRPTPGFSHAPRTTHLLSYWWVFGLALVSWRLLLSTVALVRLLRGSRRITDEGWWLALDEAATRLGVRTPVRLLESPRAIIPMTFGLHRAVIILPTESRQWPEELRQVVLLHELAHIRRGDARTNLLGQVVCALYWFHPLVWRAARRMRIEAERASDDLVLRAGAPPSAYAGHLLSMVQAIATHRAPLLAVPLAQRSAFEGRVLAILEPGVARHQLSPRAALIGIAALLAVAVPLAALAPAVTQQPTRVHRTMGRGSSPAPTPSPTPEPHVSSRGGMPTPTPTPEPMPQPDVDVGPVDVHVSPRVKVNPRVNVKFHGEAQAEHSPAAVAALIEALGDGDAELRGTAARSLGELGDTAAVDALVNALRRDASKDVRKVAAWALGQIEDRRAVAGLVAALREERDVEVRRQVVWALGQIESDEAVPGLGAALRAETDAETRRMAAWALGQIESKDALPFLVPLLRDADEEVREKTAWALGQIEDHGAVDPIASAFAAERDPAVRSQLVWALGQIEDRRAAPTLEAALRDSSLEVRRRAIWAFGQLDNLGTAPAGLIAAAKDPDVEVRRSAIRALTEIEDQSAVPALILAMHDADLDVRREAVRGLGEMRGAAAMEALVAAMRDADPEIRRLAAHALGNR